MNFRQIALPLVALATVVAGCAAESGASQDSSDESVQSTSEALTYKVQVHRLFSGTHHFYTRASAADMAAYRANGWTDEGVAFHCWNNNEGPGRQPLFRMYNSANGDHYYTTATDRSSAIAAGWHDEEILCWVPTTDVAGSCRLYRSWNFTDHFMTTSGPEAGLADRCDGYVWDGMAAVVFPASSGGSCDTAAGRGDIAYLNRTGKCPAPRSCAVCNTGGCRCDYETPEQLCANRGGVNPELGCVQQP
jgi:hypothetical protein